MTPSSRSGGWHRDRRHCRRGSIRRTAVRSRQCGSSWNFRGAAIDRDGGPSASRRKMPASRPDNSSATWLNRSDWRPEPVGHSTVKLSPEKVGNCSKRADDEAVDRHPDWSPPVGVTAEHAAVGLRRQVGDAEFLACRVEDVGVLQMV